MTRTLPLLALALTFAFGSPAAAELPTTEELERYYTTLRRGNMQTVRIERMAAEVTCVPDYFLFALADELKKTDASSEKAVLKKVKKLLKKHKKNRGKVGVIIKFTASASENDFFAMEGKITDQIALFLTGEGKARYKVVNQTGKLESRRYALYEPSQAEMWKGRSMSPKIKVNWACFDGEPYELHMVLKNDIDPEKVTELKVAVGGFMHINVKRSGKKKGLNKEPRIDFDEGSTGVRANVEKVVFKYPLTSPEVPASLALLLEDADEKKKKKKKKKDDDDDDDDDGDDDHDDDED